MAHSSFLPAKSCTRSPGVLPCPQIMWTDQSTNFQLLFLSSRWLSHYSSPHRLKTWLGRVQYEMKSICPRSERPLNANPRLQLRTQTVPVNLNANPRLQLRTRTFPVNHPGEQSHDHLLLSPLWIPRHKTHSRQLLKQQSTVNSLHLAWADLCY